MTLLMNGESNNVSMQERNRSPTSDTMSLMQGFLTMMELERGPRYEAYAELRERKLRMKYLRQEEEEEEGVEAKVPTPPRKQVKFQDGLASGRKGSSLVAQSVPDLAAVLRKENRKPMNNMLPTLMELTPPSKKNVCGVLSSARGSKSANAGEKRRGGAGAGILMPRKSYASIDEIKSLSSAATANAINGESRGVRSSRVMGRKTVLGYRHI